MSKHTPGPWEAEVNYIGDIGATSVLAPGMNVMVDALTTEEEKANAHLIAAAPCLQFSLLQMMEMVLDLVDRRTLNKDQQEKFTKAGLAMSKARGE